MVAAVRNRSVSDAQRTDGLIPVEYSDEEYVREVLQLNRGDTEALFDNTLVQQAQNLGITVEKAPISNEFQHGAQQSLSESANTATTRHTRTASCGSQESASTGITSRSSNEQTRPFGTHSAQVRRRPSSTRSLSFSEYEKYLAQLQAQNTRQSTTLPPPIPIEPAPSLFSVSTRKSYTSIKNGIRTRLRLRRNKNSQEDLK
jgi:hypothetical protein